MQYSRNTTKYCETKFAWFLSLDVLLKLEYLFPGRWYCREKTRNCPTLQNNQRFCSNVFNARTINSMGWYFFQGKENTEQKLSFKFNFEKNISAFSLSSLSHALVDLSPSHIIFFSIYSSLSLSLSFYQFLSTTHLFNNITAFLLMRKKRRKKCFKHNEIIQCHSIVS